MMTVSTIDVWYLVVSLIDVFLNLSRLETPKIRLKQDISKNQQFVFISRLECPGFKAVCSYGQTAPDTVLFWFLL